MINYMLGISATFLY